MSGPIRMTALSVLGALALAAPAQATVTSTSVTMSSATMTSDAAGDNITISSDVGTGLLRHNLSGGGFNSPTDFDTGNGGNQELTNSATTTVTVNGGDGDDVLEITGASVAKDKVEAGFTFDGGNNSDQLPVGGGPTTDTVTLGANSIAGLTGAPVTYTNTEEPGAFPNDGNDQITAAVTTPASVIGGAGDDTLALPGTGSVEHFHGETGNDTLDYSGRTTPVTVGAPTQAYFIAVLNGAQQVPPNASTKTGIGQVVFNLASPFVPNTFSYSLFLTGFALSTDISDSHIHAQVAGMNGPVVFPIGPGSGYTNLGGFFKSGSGGPDPAITEAALRTGGLYFNVHNSNGGFLEGEIRGQIGLDQSNKYRRPATGVVTDTFGVENVIGSSAGDTINGTPIAETIEGGPGPDTITGGGGSDTLRGGLGNDTLNSADGVADALLDCGGDVDVLNRDPVAIDGDAIINGCETVNPATPPPPGPGDPGPPEATISDIDPKASGKKKIKLDTGSTATCPSAASSACELTATAVASLPAAKRKDVKLASLTGSIDPGQSTDVVLTASKKASKKFRAAKRAPVTFTIHVTVPGNGVPADKSVTVKLKAPKGG